MRDGNKKQTLKHSSSSIKCFRSDYEGWKQKIKKAGFRQLIICFRSDYEGWKLCRTSFLYAPTTPVLEVTMRDGNKAHVVTLLIIYKIAF